MRLTWIAALSFVLSCGCAIMPLERATAQPATPPTEPAPAEPGPPPPAEAAPPPPNQAAPPASTPQAGPPPATPQAPPQAAPQAPPSPPASQAAPQPSTAVTHSNVNLRNGPGTSYTIVTLIPAGASVDVKGCTNEWCHVAFHGQDGYIIESSIAPGAPRPAVRRRPGYAGPPQVYGPPPGYYGPPPVYYYPPPPYGYGYYDRPYWGWRGRYWRRW